jgi:hypothetical protein
MIRTFMLCIAALAAAPAASDEMPAPGSYETEGARGSLYIRIAKDGSMKFQIDYVGVNAHVCDLAGKIKGGTGYARDPSGHGAETSCLITFRPVPGGLEVIAQDPNACADYCGANVWFEGSYFLPPAGCKPDERRERRSAFTELYNSKEYARAYETLNAYYNQCRRFLNWVEIDKVRNDLAIAQYHLGHKDECLRILKDTIGAERPDVAQLQLPPADLEVYLPVAQATWYNLRLCGKEDGKPTGR